MKKKTKWLFYIMFWLLIIVMFGSLFVSQFSIYLGLADELDRLYADKARERQIAADLRYQQAFFESDAYIEYLARERLGLVMPNEIIFVNIGD